MASNVERKFEEVKWGFQAMQTVWGAWEDLCLEDLCLGRAILVDLMHVLGSVCGELCLILCPLEELWSTSCMCLITGTGISATGRSNVHAP